MIPIILASASPRRKELLEKTGVPFVIQPGDIDEEIDALEGSPENKAEQLAYAKAAHIAAKNKVGLVLGADTIVELDGEIFGKPANRDEAFHMLTRLAGRKHSVITGMALINCETGVSLKSHEKTEVQFSSLSKQEIEAYISTGEPFDKAGGYGIQGKGALLVEKVCGCYSNVVGLPLMRLKKMLEEFGVRLLG